MMWSAMALSASYSGYLVGNTRLYWAWGSPAFTSFLLLKVSGVPLVERAGKKKWGDNTTYKAYMKGTSLLVPWFPAKLD
jgi:steroid 5-alpha reductase family enzyme